MALTMKTLKAIHVVAIVVLVPLFPSAFETPFHSIHHRQCQVKNSICCFLSTRTSLFASSATTNIDSNYNPNNEEIQRLLQKKTALLNYGTETLNGIRATDEQKLVVDALARDVEALNTTPRPAQSDLVEGTWRVRYSTAPPPSNGQLVGPIVGTALQSVDLQTGIYANELLVGGGNDDANNRNSLISATLLADWNDMQDGKNWLVNFRTISLRLFGGKVKVFTKDFDEGTSRIWTTTFVDNDMRIVRAGLTESEARRLGKSADPKDYSLFIMTREKETKNVVQQEAKIGLWDVLADPAKFMEDDD